ncbi:hypothetical protein PR048_030633 [Dryococelus australis]|uniref:DDE Tnp4 domain-containing protein n=1 Tax=Dryococelus australis TaxID=614101 RepID=A0ABQ9GA95_9NEOP|nr:hypothetical protein PR048_030633 [Dryococelus australis]
MDGCLMVAFSATPLSVMHWKPTARRIVENVFGIVAQRFRVLRKSMIRQPDTAGKVVLACWVPCNFLACRTGRQYLYAVMTFTVVTGGKRGILNHPGIHYNHEAHHLRFLNKKYERSSGPSSRHHLEN